jgi:hypothetical protein
VTAIVLMILHWFIFINDRINMKKLLQTAAVNTLFPSVTGSIMGLGSFMSFFNLLFNHTLRTVDPGATIDKISGYLIPSPGHGIGLAASLEILAISLAIGTVMYVLGNITERLVKSYIHN